MTDKERREITKLRKRGYGYKKIAALLGISLNTVKAYCRRHLKDIELPKPRTEGTCPYCGGDVIQIQGHKTKRFCSDKCRVAYWNEHPEEVVRKAMYEFTCKHCGVVFEAYGNNHRAYCSHACYIEERFGKKNERGKNEE